MAVNEDGKVDVHAAVSADLAQRFTACAKEQGLTRTAMLTMAMHEYLAKVKRKERLNGK